MGTPTELSKMPNLERDAAKISHLSSLPFNMFKINANSINAKKQICADKIREDLHIPSHLLIDTALCEKKMCFIESLHLAMPGI